MADQQPLLSRSAKDIAAYRADPAQAGGVETRPINKTEDWYGDNVYKIARVIGPAMELGMPQVTAEQLVNKMLVEGRGDAGTNQYNYNNPKAKKLYETLAGRGYDDKSATFAAAVLDTDQRAKRLNKTFEEVWNGLGTSSYTKRTGAQHSQRYEEHKGAATAPKNAEFLDYVKRAISGNLTPAENLIEALPALELQREYTQMQMPYAKIAWSHNYRDPKEKAVANALGNVEQVSGRNTADRIVKEAMHNNYRVSQGVAPRPPNKNLSASDKTLADILSSLPVFQTIATRAMTPEPDTTKK